MENDPPKSWSQAIISVIHKEGKNSVNCSSYRPISLLCCDMKISTSILAKRLQKGIKDVIGIDQTGFIPGCLGINNIRRTLNIMTVARKRPDPSMLLSLDAEKAFDRVDWLFLNHTLKKFGFNSTFVNWIGTLYLKPTSKVRVNGYIFKEFHLKRGTRQGCPLSPILFAISIEPLAEIIREERRLQGIAINGTELKISLYADDVILYISNPRSSIPVLLDCLKEYGSVSGYKFNEAKSQALMLVGEKPIDLERFASFKWPSHGFKYLGVTITPHSSQL